MIEDPPLLTIRRRIERMPQDVLDGFRGVATSWIVDALEGRAALDPAIRPVLSSTGVPRHVVGSALTCFCAGNDNLALAAALPLVEPGDILMVANEGFRGACVTGDLICGMAKNRGAVALVTDGLVRDVAILERVGLPIFAAGVTPNSCARNGPGSIGLPIGIGGRRVESGDVVVGDADGVVVVAKAQVPEVLERLVTIRQLEGELDAKVKAGQDHLPSLAELLGSDRVRWV
ncbi:MAG: RraA family protein [Geminicoccaceae bacterium]|nr:MAG: RraA family protein [Geminicoccaceae bacterium]